MQPTFAFTATVILIACATAACDKRASPRPRASPSATTQMPTEDEDPPARPREDKIDHELTAERRARIEAKIPEAAGFLVGSQLEAELQTDTHVDRAEVALEQLDARATNKWILFVGPMLDRDADGYTVTLTYHPGSKRDKMRVTPSWVRIDVTDVRGYSTVLTKDGMETAVLARYRGQGRASPGHDLVGRGIW